MSERILIISHNRDVDGMGSVILLKSIYENVEYYLTGISRANQEELVNLLNTESDKYNIIYICDLPLDEDIAEKVSLIGSNIHHFDHHKTNMGTNKYNFSTVIVEKNGEMQCATSIFYNYLLESTNEDLLKSRGVLDFVELVRIIDTWDTNSPNFNKARDLAILFDCIGAKEFIELYSNKIKSGFGSFEFTEEELEIVETRKKEINDYIDYCEQKMKIIDYNGYKCGVLTCDKYFTEVGNALCDRNPDTIDFIVLVGRRCSFRTRKDIDVSAIAQIYGGGGHKRASGCDVSETLLNDFNVDSYVLKKANK